MISTVLSFYIQEAIQANSYLGPGKEFEVGNTEDEISKADHVIEGEIYIGAQEHFYMETQSTLVVPKGEDGELEIFCSTQHAAYIQVMAL